MVEFLTLLLLTVVGWALAARTGATGIRAVAAALPLGTALVVTVEVVLLVTSLPIARPVVALAIAAVLAALLARSGTLPLPSTRLVVLMTVAIAATTALTRSFALVNVTADSFRYLTVSQLLAISGSTEFTSPFLLQTRGVGIGTLHGLALGEPIYLTALTPLFGLSILVVVWAAVMHLDEDGRERWLAPLAAAAAVALLATNNRFAFNVFYLNGHLFIAGWMLLLQLQTWRQVRASNHVPGSTLLTLVLSTALVSTRPEGALLALMVLAPTVLDRSVQRDDRAGVLAAFGAACLVWHVGVLLPVHLAHGRSVDASVVGLIALGALAVLVAATLRWVERLTPPRPLLWVHGLVWAAVLLLGAREPGIVYRSMIATYRNLARNEGGWGTSALMLAVLFVVVALLLTYRGDHALIFTVTTFVPLGLLLALLREGAYRVGPGDSLNRMLLHIVPITVLAIALGASGEPRLRAASREPHTAAT